MVAVFSGKDHVDTGRATTVLHKFGNRCSLCKDSLNTAGAPRNKYLVK